MWFNSATVMQLNTLLHSLNRGFCGSPLSNGVAIGYQVYRGTISDQESESAGWIVAMPGDLSSGALKNAYIQLL